MRRMARVGGGLAAIVTFLTLMAGTTMAGTTLAGNFAEVTYIDGGTADPVGASG